jgi:hypothetical protein
MHEFFLYLASNSAAIGQKLTISERESLQHFRRAGNVGSSPEFIFPIFPGCVILHPLNGLGDSYQDGSEQAVNPTNLPPCGHRRNTYRGEAASYRFDKTSFSWFPLSRWEREEVVCWS